jgi:hypothetical protein
LQAFAESCKAGECSNLDLLVFVRSLFAEFGKNFSGDRLDLTFLLIVTALVATELVDINEDFEGFKQIAFDIINTLFESIGKLRALILANVNVQVGSRRNNCVDDSVGTSTHLPAGIVIVLLSILIIIIEIGSPSLIFVCAGHNLIIILIDVVRIILAKRHSSLQEVRNVLLHLGGTLMDD